MAELFLDGSKLIHHLPKVNKWNKGEQIAPIHVEVSPTSLDYLDDKVGLLSENVMVDMIDDFADLGVKSVLLAGEGEPTINRGIIPMIQRAKEKGVDMALNSNAVLFDEKMSIATLAGLEWCRFTFQASNKELYNQIYMGGKSDFDKAVNNIVAAAKYKKDNNLKVRLGIEQILINENYRDVLECAKLAKELGMDYYVVKKFSKHPKNEYDVSEDLWEHSADLFDEVEKLSTEGFKVIIEWNKFAQQFDRSYRKCIGTPFITQVLADGDVYPCSQFSKDPNYIYGNLNEKSFKKIIFSEKAKEVTKLIEKVDVTKCINDCRHHETNIFLTNLTSDKIHKNFV
jgi:radical SAM protein with 4Fe4S-binding SPASM domain